MIAGSGQPEDAKPGRLEVGALCAGLLFAFSPSLVELLRHMLANPWARYAGLFPFLFARSVRARPGRPPLLGSGILWIGLGMAVELLGFLSGVPRFGRLGLVLAAVGLCRRLGRGAGSSWPLLVLAIPMPSVVFQLTSPGAEVALASIAGACLDSAGLAGGIEIAKGAVHYGSQELVLERFDSGVALVPLLAGISWYGSVLRELPIRRALLRAFCAGVLAFPLQLVAIACALLSLPLGAANAGRWALSELPWLVAAGVGLAAIEWQLRRGDPPHEI